jgi:ferredoxin
VTSADQSRLVVDPTLCVASQDCILTEPDLFELDEDDIARVKDAATVDSLGLDELIRIVKLCPTTAISIRDGEK